MTTCALPGANAPTGPTATPTQTIIYENSLTRTDYHWPVNTICSFASDGYHIKLGYICYAPVDALADADMSVAVNQIRGMTTLAHGIVFRRESEGNYYEFAINSKSEWVFTRCALGDCIEIGDVTVNAAIQDGLNTKNTLEVRAIGSYFDFFVNGTQVGQANDARLGAGTIGMTGSDFVEVVYNNITVIKPSAQPYSTV
jgi:hypothetical protein